MELIFILTYDCNFRCTYCDIHKRKQDMTRETIDKSLCFLSNSDFEIDKVKFFWWEPLIKKNDIYYIIDSFPVKSDMNFYVTSNSTLVTDEFISFSKLHNLKVTFSLDGDIAVTWKNRKPLWWWNLSYQIIQNTKKYHDFIRVNQVITSENANSFFENFMFIYNLWVRSFNFLPEYYREWSKQWLNDLQKWFQRILDFYEAWNLFYVVNTENYSDTSFFNLWIVIDTDGSIYGTNLILAWIFEQYKPELKIWDIINGLMFDINDKEFNMKYIKKINSYLNIQYGKNILNSVRYVDLILNNFVNKLDIISSWEK